MLLVLLGLLAGLNPTADVYSGLEKQIRVAVPRIEATIVVDGVLDEPAWQQAARLTGFSEYSPADGRPAEDETEVLVWYAPTAICFGIRAHAPAGTVRATLADRDKIDGDDSVQIFLGTFNDNRQALMFAVNPLGVQADGALMEGVNRSSQHEGLSTSRETPDLSPDFVFQSKGRLTEFGYEVEVRIPFKTLRYQPAQSQDWGLHVIRRVQATGHEESWVAARRAGTSFLAQSGTLAGLTDLRRGLVLELNPVVTGKVDGAPSERGWRYDAGSPEFGGNVRWGLTSNLTMNGTINPDFSQVEADAGQFVFDPRQALYFQEKRPFFLEGLEQFATPSQLIYTRRIVEPVVAAKLTGKVSDTTVALLSAVDGQATSLSGIDYPLANALRVQRDLGAESKVALVYTDRLDHDYSNHVIGADSQIALGGLYSLQLQAAASRTRQSDSSLNGPLWQASLSRNGRTFGFKYLVSGISDDFRDATGFIARAGIAVGRLQHRLTWYGKPNAFLESWSGDCLLDATWQYLEFVQGHSSQDRRFHLGNSFAMRGGWRASATAMIESFGYDRAYYANYALLGSGANGPEILPFVGAPRFPNLDWELTLDTPRFSTFSGSVFYIWGRDENFFEWSRANIVFFEVSGEWRPTGQIRVTPAYQLQQYDRRTDGSTVSVRKIPRLKIEYQVTRSIFLRLVTEYDSERQDDLRDDGRTELPIVIRDPATGEYSRAFGFKNNRLRTDFLFSYQPTPGTVVFAGYGSIMTEPELLRSGSLRRTSDGFFVKVSYLFRL
jgi:Domain of unknown function (DUF5916)